MFAISTSGQTIEALFPPNSRVTHFSMLAQVAMMCLPIIIKLVKEIF